MRKVNLLTTKTENFDQPTLDCYLEIVHKPLKEKGEDAFAYNFESDAVHYQAVFDGCGGSGSWQYAEYKNATGAFSGSSNTTSVAHAATRSSVTATPKPTVAPTQKTTTAPRTATPAPTREFAINANVTYNKGKTTVRWTDSQNGGPYNMNDTQL